MVHFTYTLVDVCISATVGGLWRPAMGAKVRTSALAMVRVVSGALLRMGRWL